MACAAVALLTHACGRLYTVYSIPNVILPFLGGSLVDKIGCRFCFIAFCALLAVGQFVFALGVQMESIAIMYLGRVIFGLGGENLCVVNSTLQAQWFKGREVALAMGISLSLSRAGSVVNNMLTPMVFTQTGNVSYPLWLGFVLLVIGMLAAVLVVILDKKADDEFGPTSPLASPTMSPAEPDTPLMGTEKIRSPNLDTIMRRRQSMSRGHLGHLQRQHYLARLGYLPAKFNQKDIMYQPIHRAHKVSSAETEEVRCSDMLQLSLSFWLLSISCVVVYACVMPFNNIANDFLQTKWYNSHYCPHDLAHEQCLRLTRGRAALVMSIPYTISLFASPFLGSLCDRYGMRAVLLGVSALFLMAVHCVLAWSTLTPVVPLTFMGISYSIYAAAVWPAVALVVPERALGTAYGLITSLQNGGLAAVPLLVAYVKQTYNYIAVEIFFAGCASLGVVTGILINLLDLNTPGQPLNSPTKDNSNESRPSQSLGEISPVMVIQQTPPQHRSSISSPPRRGDMNSAPSKLLT